MRKFALVALLGLMAANQAAAFVPAVPRAAAPAASRTGAYSPVPTGWWAGLWAWMEWVAWVRCSRSVVDLRWFGGVRGRVESTGVG